MSTKPEAAIPDMDGSLRRSFWRSIRFKTVLLVLLMVILIVVLGVVGTVYYQSIIKQKIDDDTRSSAETIAAFTPSFMNITQVYLQSIADRPLVIKAIQDNDSTFLHSTAIYANNTSRINTVYFTDSKGIILESTPELSGLIGSNAINHSYVSSVLRTGDGVIGDGEPGFNQMPVVPIGVPVKDGNGTVIGVLVGTVDLRELEKIVTVGTTANYQQYVYMVNRTGHIMFHNNPEYAREMSDFTSVPGVQSVLRGETGVAEYMNPVENQTRLAGYAPVEPMGWGVVVAIPANEAYQPVWNATWMGAVMILLFSILASGLGLYIGNGITTPITNLSQATRTAFKDDDYRKLLPLGHDDEVGDLARSFNNMIDRIKQDIVEREKEAEAREQLLTQLEEKTADLQKSNEALEVNSEEITAQSEEIECANEELRCNNEELQNITSTLRETKDYLEKLIDNANAPIIVWDPKFTITKFNNAFERLSGFTANEMIGKGLSILFPKESREESLNKINKTLKGEQWESVEIPIIHKSGGISTILWNSANIYGDDNSLQATIAQGQDITRRKQTEKELEESKYQADLYLDLMGHDISNMHQIIMAQLELSREIITLEGRLEGDDRELIDTSITTLGRAAKLIDNVRKLQKLGSGEYSLEDIDLCGTVEDVLNQYSKIPDRDITIKFTPNGKCMVRANPLLKDIFSNLVDNAVKHSSDPLTLAVNISRVGHNGKSYYRVAFEDSGSGIPDDKKEEIFQRFKRGQTKARGTGLGLYLVKTLVENFLGLRGSPEQGSRRLYKGHQIPDIPASNGG